MNLNPRSIYNKAEEFCLLLDMYETDICFMSETWDRADKPLEDIIKKESGGKEEEERIHTKKK